MVGPENDSDWKAHRLLVLETLRRMETAVQGLAQHIAEVRTEIAVLKVKAAIGGAVAGAVLSVVVTAVARAVGG
jgi:DNA-binding FrmR family transcriptional regulator